MQLLLAHLPDEHLEQAADHEQCIVGLPNKQLTAEEKHKEDAALRSKTDLDKWSIGGGCGPVDDVLNL